MRGCAAGIAAAVVRHARSEHARGRSHLHVAAPSGAVCTADRAPVHVPARGRGVWRAVPARTRARTQTTQWCRPLGPSRGGGGSGSPHCARRAVRRARARSYRAPARRLVHRAPAPSTPARGRRRHLRVHAGGYRPEHASSAGRGRRVPCAAPARAPALYLSELREYLSANDSNVLSPGLALGLVVHLSRRHPDDLRLLASPLSGLQQHRRQVAAVHARRI